MPQRSSWLAVQTLINQHLTDLAILAGGSEDKLRKAVAS